jgi:hypothetical protein
MAAADPKAAALFSIQMISPSNANAEVLGALAWLIGVIFGAGGAWTMLRQVRRDVAQLQTEKASAKDLNGIGAKVRTIEDKAADRYLAVVIATNLFVPDKYKAELARVLLNAGLRR